MRQNQAFLLNVYKMLKQEKENWCHPLCLYEIFFSFLYSEESKNLIWTLEP